MLSYLSRAEHEPGKFLRCQMAITQPHRTVIGKNAKGRQSTVVWENLDKDCLHDFHRIKYWLI